MKIIIPMAGRGSRLRPHTLTVPKPLVPIAGKPIVQRLVEDLVNSFGSPVEEVAFIIGDFEAGTADKLIKIAESVGAKGSVYTQNDPLGTAHAILCAQESLSGNCMVAFADTLFKADFKFDPNEDGIVWVQKVEDPSSFGVVKVNEEGIITDFVEKSPTFVSDLAIVGIYYFNDGENLRDELQYLIDNNIKDKGEFQLTSALENMKQKGKNFKVGHITEWLDCGNKDAVVYSNRRMLEFSKGKMTISPTAVIDGAVINPPCYIGEGVVIRNSIVGPYVSIGDNSEVLDSVIKNSIIQNDSKVINANLENSMLGNVVEYSGKKSEISIGDFSKYSL